VSEPVADYLRTQGAAKRAALLSAACDLDIDVTGPSVARAKEADDRFAVAARCYVRAVDALPLERKRQITGWVEPAHVNPETVGGAA
jgi:hypothetical protein